MAKQPPPPESAGQGAQKQKAPIPPPSSKKVKPVPRPTAEPPKLPPVKKKGRGKIWAGVIGIIIGIILVAGFQGMSIVPFIGVLIILLSVYLLYKGLTEVDKVLVPEKVTVGGKIRTKMVYKPRKSLNKGFMFLIIVFIFFSLPIFLTLFQFGNVSDQPYSVFNTGDGGCSTFREDIEGMGYSHTAIVSSYAQLEKFPDDYPLNHTVLFVIGPKMLFFPTELFPIQQMLDAGGKVVILQDIGSANEGLLFLGLLSFFRYANPLDLPFQDGILCEGTGGGDPTSAAFSASLSIAGGSYNVLFWTASPLGGTLSPFAFVDYAPESVWLDRNKNFIKDSEDVTVPGGYPITATAGNLVIISDPDILTNRLMADPGYENRAFASALVVALTSGDTTWNIIFDESHQAKHGYSAAFYFGLIIAIEDFILLSWFFAPLGPYLAFKLTKKFIPEAEKPEKVQLSKVKREGESLYTKRLDWFKRGRRYEKALAVLYRRLRRSLTTTLKMKGFDKDEAITTLLNIHPEGIDEKQLVKAFETFEQVEKGRRVYYEEEFLKIFLEMQWVASLATPK
ncbi:MAG: hypothetical protein EU536_00025 [Promethearchaeota archaeon]|nr:MAG: hypothetical protein EU536_00025 [Candidatus Lokiarchaeota archaeon]